MLSAHFVVHGRASLFLSSTCDFVLLIVDDSNGKHGSKMDRLTREVCYEH